MVTRKVNKWGEGGRLRGELVEAAVRLLSQANLRDAVTLRAIAREAGIAAPSIYHHFPDRDAVIDAVVSETFQELDAVCERAYHSEPAGPGRVRAISRAYVAFALEHPDQYRVLFERSTANRSAGSGPYPVGLHAFQYLVEAFKEVEGGRASHEAEALWVSLHGVVTLRPANPNFPWAPIDAIVGTILDRFVPDPERGCGHE